LEEYVHGVSNGLIVEEIEDHEEEKNPFIM